MRIRYVHSANIRIPSANAVQVMRMCEAFAAQGAATELVYPEYLTGNVIPSSERYAYYGLAPTFGLRPLTAPFTAGLMRVPAYLPVAKLVAYAADIIRDATHPETQRPDVIFTRCATAALAMPSMMAWRGEERPLVVFEAHEFPRDRFRAAGLDRVDAVVAITQALADELRAERICPADRILVSPDGVPESWLAPIDRDGARRRLNLLAARPLVVFTGRLQADVVPMLFEAADQLRDVAELVVVGSPSDDDGRALDRMREAARTRALPVKFVGAVRAEEARLYQAAADMLLAPYTGTLRWARYTSPLKIFEYMAAGRPMIVSDLPVLHEVLTHGESAWLVPAASGAALADGVKTLIARPDLSERLARLAREKAPAYTWNRRARFIIDFLERRSWR